MSRIVVFLGRIPGWVATARKAVAGLSGAIAGLIAIVAGVDAELAAALTAALVALGVYAVPNKPAG